MVMALMRKHAKSWLIKFLIGIIALVFIFYFGYSFTSTRGLKIALVNGDLITGAEYQKAYRDMLEGLQRQYKSAWNDNLIKMFDLKNRALSNLINEKLITQEARKLGLDVTENEVQKAIMKYPAFQLNGRFDMRRYNALLSQNRMKPEDFEGVIARELLKSKMRQFLFTFMEITDQELLDNYAYNNNEIKISFVEFKPEDFKKSVQPDKTSMAEFFKEHRSGYRIPEKIKIVYHEIDPKRFKEQISVSIKDKDIQDYYEYNIEMFSQPKQVQARHILLKLDPDALETEAAAVRKKADKILKQARQGKDFASLAKKYSEGPSRSEGGDLGYFSKGQMERPFEDVAFKLKKGEISDLVRTRFGYHIIKAEDIKKAGTKTLDDVRDQIVDNLTAVASIEMANERALSFLDQMPYDVDLVKYTSDQGLEVGVIDFFSENEPVPVIGGDKKLRNSLFSMKNGETSDLIELNDKFYVFQVAEMKVSYLPEMTEVFDQVKNDFIADAAAKMAKEAAGNYLVELKKGRDWHKLAKEKNMVIKESDFFKRGDSPVKGIGSVPGLKEAAFGLNKDKRYPDADFGSLTGVFVIRWEAIKGIDKKKYEKEKQEYRLFIMDEKHRMAFENWLEDLRRNAEIEIITPVSD